MPHCADIRHASTCTYLHRGRSNAQVEWRSSPGARSHSFFPCLPLQQGPGLPDPFFIPLLVIRAPARSAAAHLLPPYGFS